VNDKNPEIVQTAVWGGEATRFTARGRVIDVYENVFKRWVTQMKGMPLFDTRKEAEEAVYEYLQNWLTEQNNELEDRAAEVYPDVSDTDLQYQEQVRMLRAGYVRGAIDQMKAGVDI
jgi:hypothetical protein